MITTGLDVLINHSNKYTLVGGPLSASLLDALPHGTLKRSST